ncbi:hypothetical protein ACLK2H_13165 [Escherichia coli]
MLKEHGVRRYGARGYHHFLRLLRKRQNFPLNKPVEELNIITCHLGNGGSVSAIRNGKCVDTSMGLTPLEGLVMGTRSGDIDPAIIFHLHDTLGMNIDQINKMLTKESGLLGLTEVTSDCRYVEDNYKEKADAKRAMDVYCHRLAKYIGSYTALMDGRLDAVIFTGGIGENAAMVRELFPWANWAFWASKLISERNLAARFGKSGFINRRHPPCHRYPDQRRAGHCTRRQPSDCLISHRQPSWRCCFVSRLKLAVTKRINRVPYYYADPYRNQRRLDQRQPWRNPCYGTQRRSSERL